MEGDTVVAISVVQLVKINRYLNDYEYLKEANTLLERDLLFSGSMQIGYKGIISMQAEMIDYLHVQRDSDLQIRKSLEAQYKQDKRKLRKKIFGVGAGCVIAGTVLGLLISN